MGEFKSPSEQQNKTAAQVQAPKETKSPGEAEFVDTRSSTFQLKKFQSASSDKGSGSNLSQLQSKSSNHTGSSRIAQLQQLSDTRSASEQASPVQRKENKTGLPDDLKSGMESVSGMSLNDVRVHRNSDKPAQLQAHAYAQGTDIHLAPGQEKHLPHELGHVVQQKKGIVKPTKKLDGNVAINDDKGLETGADKLGSKALSASGETQPTAQLKEVNTTSTAVQRSAMDVVQREETAPAAETQTPASAEPAAAAPAAEKLATTEETISIGGFEITYTNDPNENKQSIEGTYEESDWSIKGERELKDKDKNIWQYTITGGTPASLSTPPLGFSIPLAVIPLGVPGLTATVTMAGDLSAGISGTGSVKFLSDGNTITNPSAYGSLTAGVEANVSLSGGVTAGIPFVIGATGGVYSKLSGKIEGNVDLKPTAAGLKMDSKLAGEVKGSAGLFAEANILWFTKRKELVLCEGKFGEFEGTKENLPFSKEGFKQLANIRSYDFKRDTSDDGKTAKERTKAAEEVRTEAAAKKAEEQKKAKK
jgi:hypothetical protein